MAEQSVNTEPDAPPTPPIKSLRKESIWEVYYPVGLDVEKSAIPVTSYPMIIDFWPTVLAMLSCRALQRFAGIGPTLARLVGGGVLAFNLMVIVTISTRRSP